jgi:hypothetical protein
MVDQAHMVDDPIAGTGKAFTVGHEVLCGLGVLQKFTILNF